MSSKFRLLTLSTVMKLEQSRHETITRIQQQQCAVLEPPSQTICKSCDIRSLCRRERIIG